MTRRADGDLSIREQDQGVLLEATHAIPPEHPSPITRGVDSRATSGLGPSGNRGGGGPHAPKGPPAHVRVVGQLANFSIWETATVEELHAVLQSLPMYPFMTISVTPIIKHGSIPAL